MEGLESIDPECPIQKGSFWFKGLFVRVCSPEMLLCSSSAVLLAEVESLPSLCDRACCLTTQRAGALLEQYFPQSKIMRDGGILQASGCSPALMNEQSPKWSLQHPCLWIWKAEELLTVRMSEFISQYIQYFNQYMKFLVVEKLLLVRSPTLRSFHSASV